MIPKAARLSARGSTMVVGPTGSSGVSGGGAKCPMDEAVVAAAAVAAILAAMPACDRYHVAVAGGRDRKTKQVGAVVVGKRDLPNAAWVRR